MQINSITDTNYIGNPTFGIDTNGWVVAGGTLSQVSAPTYSSIGSGQFTPSGNYCFAEYDVTGMSTGLPYVAQARVLAGAGQQVFIQFNDGTGQLLHTATGNWDLLTTSVVVKNIANFGVQVGISFGLSINVSDGTVITETPTVTETYGLKAVIG